MECRPLCEKRITMCGSILSLKFRPLIFFLCFWYVLKKFFFSTISTSYSVPPRPLWLSPFFHDELSLPLIFRKIQVLSLIYCLLLYVNAKAIFFLFKALSNLCLYFSGFEDLNFGSDSKINLVHDGNGYHGLVEEGATVVNVTPPIKVEKTDGRELLCKILILQDGQRDDDTPFEVSFVARVTLNIKNPKVEHFL